MGQILLHLQADELDCHSHVSASRRHETPGSETEDYHSQQFLQQE